MRVAEDCGDSMPHKNEIHLPFLQVQDVYEVFAREFKTLYPSAEDVATDYFRRVWLLHCHHIKIMKSTSMTDFKNPYWTKNVEKSVLRLQKAREERQMIQKAFKRGIPGS